MKFIGFYDYTVVLTYLSLISGVLGMRFASIGKIGAAIGCLLLSGFCDLFDGVVARTKKNRTRDEKNFGIQIDSLCDAVCFGVFPAVILYFSGVDTLFGIAILVFYVLCAIIRLAFFNVLEAKRQETEGGCTKNYRGLPVTTASMIFPLFYAVGFFVPVRIMTIVYHVLALITAVAFIADFACPKFNVGKLLHSGKNAKEDYAHEKSGKI